MSEPRNLRRLGMGLAYLNVALLLAAITAGSKVLLAGSLTVGGIGLLVTAWWAVAVISAKRRERLAAQRHPILFAALSGRIAPGRLVVLESGERVTPLGGGWKVVELPRGGRHYIQECSHWPRDEVKLNDGTTVAYICRRCDHNWANEDYVRQGAR